jgi:hypothetical protein
VRAALVGLVLVSLAVLMPAYASPTGERTEVFPGSGAIVHIGQGERPAGTSKAFRSFLQKRLTHLWKSRGGGQVCRETYLARVEIWQSQGSARAKDGQVKDAQSFDCGYGLFTQVYVREGKRWTAPPSLSTKRPTYGDSPIQRGKIPCSAERWYDVSNRVAPRKCELDWGPAARYRDFVLPLDYGTAPYAAQTIARSFGSTRDHLPLLWATGPVLDSLDSMRYDGAPSFTIDGCGDGTNPDYAPYLGGAPAGCLLDVFYGDYRALYMLQLWPGREGHWRARGLEAVASS